MCVCVCVCIVVNKCTQYIYKTVFLYFKRAAAVQSKVVLCVSFHFVFMHFPFDAALQEIKSKGTMNPIVRWKKKLFYSLRKSRTTNANADNKFRIEKTTIYALTRYNASYFFYPNFFSFFSFI